MIDHFIHSHSQSIVISLDNTPQRVAHQQHLYSCFIENARKNIVVRRQASDLLAALLHFNNMRGGYLFAHGAPPETKKPSGTNPEGHRGRKSRFLSPNNRLLASVSVQITWIQAVCS